MRLSNFNTIVCRVLEPEQVVGAPVLAPAEIRQREEQAGAVPLFEGDARAAMYRAWRRRGHPAVASLRVAYGPHHFNRRDGDRAAFDAMAPDLAAVLHESMCPGCRACIRDALRVVVVDQTFGIAVSDTPGEAGDDDAHVLLVGWGDVFGSLEIDEAEDLCVEWLEAECWRPDDGAAEAARVAWAANGLVNEASVEAWVVARRAARGVCVAPDDRGHARGQCVGARK